MYTNNGYKFFDKMYDYIMPEDIRKEPVTKAEFLNAGFSEDVFNQYILLIRRLYGECLIESCNVAEKYVAAKFNESLWTEFTDFCIDNKLLQEFSDENGKRMPVFAPPELFRFQFIYDYPECPDCIHICTLDEFRLKIEMLLTDKYDDAEWYLDIHYGVKRIFKNDHEYFAHYDINVKDYVPLAECEIDEISSMIYNDIGIIEEELSLLKEKRPDSIESLSAGTDSVPVDVFINSLNAQKLWIDECCKLEKRLSLLNSCFENIMPFDEDDFYFQTDIVFDADNTLYIYKGHIICEQEHHNTEQAVGVLQDIDGNEIELNCMHCVSAISFI